MFLFSPSVITPSVSLLLLNIASCFQNIIISLVKYHSLLPVLCNHVTEKIYKNISEILKHLSDKNSVFKTKRFKGNGRRVRDYESSTRKGNRKIRLVFAGI